METSSRWESLVLEKQCASSYTTIETSGCGVTDKKKCIVLVHIIYLDWNVKFSMYTWRRQVQTVYGKAIHRKIEITSREKISDAYQDARGVYRIENKRYKRNV